MLEKIERPARPEGQAWTDRRDPYQAATSSRPGFDAQVENSGPDATPSSSPRQARRLTRALRHACRWPSLGCARDKADLGRATSAPTSTQLEVRYLIDKRVGRGGRRGYSGAAPSAASSSTRDQAAALEQYIRRMQAEADHGGGIECTASPGSWRAAGSRSAARPAALEGGGATSSPGDRSGHGLLLDPNPRGGDRRDVPRPPRSLSPAPPASRSHWRGIEGEGTFARRPRRLPVRRKNERLRARHRPGHHVEPARSSSTRR